VGESLFIHVLLTRHSGPP